MTPEYGHMPTEFPAEAAARIGRAILNRAFTLELLSDAYDVLGYGLRMLIGDGRPTFGAGLDEDVSEDRAAELLIAAGETADGFASPGRYGDGAAADVGGAIPWATVVPMVLRLILTLALGKKS